MNRFWRGAMNPRKTQCRTRLPLGSRLIGSQVCQRAVPGDRFFSPDQDW
jgi:hypothetical protein